MLRLDYLYGVCEEIMYWCDSGAPEIPEWTELSETELRALDRISLLLEQAGSNTAELRQLGDSIWFMH